MILEIKMMQKKKIILHSEIYDTINKDDSIDSLTNDLSDQELFEKLVSSLDLQKGGTVNIGGKNRKLKKN